RINQYLTSNQGLTIDTVGQSSIAGSVIAIQDGKLRYIPAPGFTGLDTFTYTVSNGVSTTTGTVSVSVVDIQDFEITVSREKTEEGAALVPTSATYLTEW